MKVVIENLYSEQVWALEGTPSHVEAAVLLLFPWLRSPHPEDRGDLEALLDDVASQQAFMVKIAWE